MKVLIVGCGVIGSIYGWVLSQAGQDVTHLVRKNKIEALQNGIKLDVYDLRATDELSVTDQQAMALLNESGRGTTAEQLQQENIPDDLTQTYSKEQLTSYSPKLIDEIPDNADFDLVMLPTKHYQLTDTLKQIYAKLPQANYLIFCAHWGGLAEIDAVIPRSQYLFGYAASSGGYDNDTMVVNIRRDYRIGDFDGQHAELLQKVINLFNTAGFVADVKENMLEWLWVHHAINGGTIGTMIYAGGFDAFLNNPEFKDIFLSATLEAIEVLKARGVDIKKYPDITPFLKLSAEQVVENYRKLFLNTPIGQRTMRAGHHKHSMHEMRQYYLDVLAKGEELGVEMPVLESMKDKINYNFSLISN